MHHAPLKGLIFDIQRFSIHDGPGIRTTVFFKGCNMRCLWCQNPESLNPKPEIAFYPSKCCHSGACKKVCPETAINLNSQRRIIRSKCTVCGECAKVCPSDAIRVVGKYYTPMELLELVLRDIPFFENSNGGITLSGGEPLLQSEFVIQFAKLVKSKGIHLAVETAGNIYPKTFSKCIEPFDLVLYDLKAIDNVLHKKLTGAGNKQIIHNLQLLIQSGKPVWVRVPLIPKHTMTNNNLESIAKFISELGVNNIYLLIYHSMGEAKIKPIESKQPKLGLKTPNQKQITDAISSFKNYNIDIKIER